MKNEETDKIAGCLKTILLFIFVLFLSSIYSQTQPQTSAGKIARPISMPGTELTTTQPGVILPVEAEPVVYGFDLFRMDRPQGDQLGVSILPPNYLLGPGDQVGIYLIGSEPINFDVVVNVEGKIFIPAVGVLPVAGMTLNEFNELLDQKIAHYYANYKIELMLLSPKYIRVTIVGDVQKPGNYDISALSSVLDAVVQAGGPNEKGSLRNIQLFRNNQLVAYYDLYNFLMKGESQERILMQTSDRIYVPFMESKVKVSGEVRRQAIFELRSTRKEYLKDIIELAGGFTEFAFIERIEISRLQENSERILSYFDYRQILRDSTLKGPELKNQDWIHVYSILEQRQEAIVSISGDVRRPGIYKWQDSLRVSDLVLMSGNITRSAYLLSAEVVRVDPLKPAKVTKINLEQALNSKNPKHNLLLEEDDIVYIRQIPEWEVGLTVYVQGELQFPGTYSIVRDSTWLSQIVQQAGGFTKDALIREAVVIRKSSKLFIDKEFERLQGMTSEQMNESEYQYFVMKQNMRDVGQVLVDFYQLFIKKDQSEDIILEPGDIIEVPKAPVVVQVTGRVSRPGGVLYRPKMKLKYYLEKAGGLTWDADVGDTKITKISGEIADYGDVSELVAGDIIWVPRKPHRNWWLIFRDTVAVVAQLATAYYIVQNAGKK